MKLVSQKMLNVLTLNYICSMQSGNLSNLQIALHKLKTHTMHASLCKFPDCAEHIHVEYKVKLQ